VQFAEPLHSGILIKRYKRFLADIRLDDGKVITAHCPNSGSMKTCKTTGWRVLLSDSGNPKRRYPYTWEIDILLEKGTEVCYIEVKNVTLVEEDGCYYFPDAVTERGRKHLQELMACVRQGQRAVMFFVIQRSDGSLFKPAAHIDPVYAETLKEAQQAGVELLAYRAEVSSEQITLNEKIPCLI
jgi:sugar fermentation stimulation protein A